MIVGVTAAIVAVIVVTDTVDALTNAINADIAIGLSHSAVSVEFLLVLRAKEVRTQFWYPNITYYTL